MFHAYVIVSAQPDAHRVITFGLFTSEERAQAWKASHNITGDVREWHPGYMDAELRDERFTAFDYVDASAAEWSFNRPR